jgi:hypothetical protein
VVVAGLVVAGCERSRDHAVEKVVEAAIAAHGRDGSVVIDREHGSIRVTLGRARVPAGWPEAVPIYDNATKAKIEDRHPDHQRVSVTTDDSPKEIGEFYRRTLSEAGWRLQVADSRDWSGERGTERIRLRVASRDSIAGGSRAEIEYRSGGGKE